MLKLRHLLITLLLIFSFSLSSAAITDDLIAYYKVDENAANTNVTDAHDNYNATSSTNTNNLYNSSGKINSAFDLEGSSGEYVSTGIRLGTEMSRSDPFTIQIWFKAESWGASYYTNSLFIDGTSNLDGVIFIRGGSSDVRFSLIDSNSAQPSTSAGALSTGVWYHLVATWDGTSDADGVKLYLNGSEVDSATASSGTLYTRGTDGFEIGRDPHNSRYFDGIVDEIGIWNRSLSSTEVEDLYNSGSGLAYPFTASDTCTCAGLNQNWEIDMSDYCVLSTSCDLGTGNLTFVGSGNFTCSSDLAIYSLLDIPNNAIMWIDSDCEVII